VPQIALVSNQHDHDIAIRMVSQLLQPPRHVLVCLVLADVVDEESADCASVVRGRDRTVSLLASCVPDLGFDGLGVDLDATGREFDADGRLGVEVEFVAGESAEQVGFTDARVTDQDDWGWLEFVGSSRLSGRLPLKRNCRRALAL